jgi:hypothetical protein
VGICREHSAGFVDSVELTVCGEGIAFRDMTPDLIEVEFRARSALDVRH